MDQKQRILAIDDETDMLLLVASALRAEDFEVLTANNGKDGLELAKKEKPDAVILDVKMPEMSGFEVLEQLRLDPETQQLPVIMLTGISERSKIQSRSRFQTWSAKSAWCSKRLRGKPFRFSLKLRLRHLASTAVYLLMPTIHRPTLPESRKVQVRTPLAPETAWSKKSQMKR